MSALNDTDQVGHPAQALQPDAWLVVGVGLFPAKILACTFEGGILETAAVINAGAWTALKVSNGIETFTVNVHVLEVADGHIAFRLYGTDGVSRSLWDSLVRDRRDDLKS